MNIDFDKIPTPPKGEMLGQIYLIGGAVFYDAELAKTEDQYEKHYNDMCIATLGVAYAKANITKHIIWLFTETDKNTLEFESKDKAEWHCARRNLDPKDHIQKRVEMRLG
jgi:hypothetical protein